MRRAGGSLIALLVAAVSAAVPAAGQEPGASTGRLEGVATISTRLTTTRVRVRAYTEPGTPPPRPAVEDPLANVVLYLQSAPALSAVPGTPAPAPSMRQEGERFVPHVLAVRAGTTVEFPNDDPIYHNVFSLSRGATFDLGRYPRGQSKQVRFATPGVVQVFCHIHADMSGTILVLDNPFFTVPASGGRYVLDGIPPGEYRLVAWHERIRPMITTVRIVAGRTTHLDLRIPLPDTTATP